MRRLFERLLWEGGVYRVRTRTGPINNCGGGMHCVGLLWNPHALWVGAHYSSHNKRLCLNILPGVTLWWTQPGGQLP